MRPIHLHDTRSGELVELRPRDPGRVGIYACGPTVYSRIHIGNARPFVVFSLLERFLEHEGYATTLVVNVTDVNDKIYDAARPRGIPSERLAAEMTAHYLADTDALGLGRPDREPLASETMSAIVDYIRALVDRGHAYESEGDVYFKVRSDPAYGSLSHRRLEDMDQGEATDLECSRRKRDPLDFALWKATKPGEDTAWDSPWGRGRPGWHIECSAMAEAELGVGFDIHGGGSDLVFPHHENEAAQTRAARGRELARVWMHNGMIQLTGEKMAKSAGNIAPLHEVIERHGRDAVLTYLVSGHYRQPLAFSAEELEDAARRVQRVRDALRRLSPGRPSPPDMAHHRDAFFEALANDFNTPAALACMFEWIREANRRAADLGPGAGDGGTGEGDTGVGDADLREMLAVLGLGELEPLRALGDVGAIDPEAASLLERRERARAERDFQTADALRDELRERGWEIRDGPAGGELLPR
ncbi:MAG TPA: cysteine--tRNA ligase [Solirubrobacteraceae bacterium]|nr:cysteine--tRNA ligase [Solirubrobacteraceae bacterium]